MAETRLESAAVPAEKLVALQQKYAQDLALLCTAYAEGKGLPQAKDKRFSGPEWNGFYGFAAALYLLNERYLMQMAESVEADVKTRERVRFAIQYWVEAMSPANFLATNPEAQHNLLETNGKSLRSGILNMLGDLSKGKVSQTDESAFEVGRNLAVTPGAVVFENDYFQLIQYTPATPQVHALPLLMVPPCINKYYILDLQPENSLGNFLVGEGHTVFLVSRRNPGQDMAKATWDDYIEHGPIRAMEVVQDITDHKKLNVFGFCVGGTIVSTALAVLAARGKHPAASLTLLTTLLDFSDTGVLDVLIDENQVQFFETTLASQHGGQVGLMRGVDLGATFSFLRPIDLVWSYVVGNYLKGGTPPA